MENRGAGKHTFLTSHQLLLTWRNCFKNNYNFTRQTKKESFHIILLLPSTFFNLSSLYNKNTILLFICNKILLPIFHWPFFFLVLTYAKFSITQIYHSYIASWFWTKLIKPLPTRKLIEKFTHNIWYLKRLKILNFIFNYTHVCLGLSMCTQIQVPPPLWGH